MGEIYSRNPATGAIVATFPEATPADIDGAIARAREAQASWANRPCRERVALLLQLRDRIVAHQDALARLISEENGKPQAEAISADLFPVLELIAFYAKHAEAWLAPQRIGLGKWNLLGRKSYIEYYPMGVVAIVSPWNFPWSIPMGQVAMALVAGNSVILKPSEITPRIGLKIGELCREAGFPEGLVQVVVGGGATGAYLVSHAQIDKIIFTGSVATGKKIMAAASANLTPVTLELGGKDPMIVLDDANIDVATSAALWGAFTNCGQCCASVERVYVHESIYAAFMSMLVEKASHLSVGPWTNSNSDIGPMTFEGQREKVRAHVDDAVRRGAKVVWQSPLSASEAQTGFFYPPTILAQVDHTFPVVMDETFGPVLPIMTFRNEAEAIRLAGDSPYGLTASIWTRDIARGERMARELKTGTVTINEVTYTFALPQTPWGGPKESGVGRTHGRMGLMDVVESRHIHINRLTAIKSPWWYPYAGGKARGLRALSDVLSNPSWKARLKALISLRFLRETL